MPRLDKSRASRAPAVAFAILVAAIAAAPFVAYPFFVMNALCFALFACAFNLLIGYVGLLSLGHAMFFGLGAYLCAHAAKALGWPVEGALVAAIVVAAVLGAVTGALAIRSVGIYFAMITVAFSQMVYFFCVQAPFTHGEDGIQSVPKTTLLPGVDFGDAPALYAYVAAIFLAGFALTLRIVNSPFGEVLKAVRDNEMRAISLGYRAPRYKLAAFTLSAAIAGLAGGLKVIVEQNASLDDVSFSTSGAVVLMTLIGGMGTLYGPIVGAFVVKGMQSYLGGLGPWVTVIQGLVFVAVVLLFRRGVIGEIAHRTGWRL